MRDVFGYMLGPKAENLDLFRQLVEEAMLDHAFWRRNYHPEDMSLIDADIRMDTHYQRFVNRMRDGLFEFLGEAKAGVPFFSPRYIAHMNTDLLIPAMVGYFGAMLYNSNNVAEESSPATARFEVRVSKMLLKMVGYDSERGWGYLTSGGTTANIYSMWVVRNLKTYPLALRCMVAFKKVKDACAVKAGFLKAEASLTGREIEAIGREAIEAVAGLTLSTPKGDGKKPLKDMTGWELANIPIRDLKRLRQDCVDAVAARLQMNKGADVLLDELVKPFEIRILGTLAFADAIRETFPNEKELRSLKCSFYAPLNHHYSWPKAGDVLGLGKDSLRGVKHRSGFDMDIDDLCRLIAEDLSGEPARWPLAVCSTFGTTEEGALDDLAKIQLKLDDLRRERGVNLWHHVDACYGGYLASMIRKPDGSPEPVTADEMKKWLHECAIGVGLDEGTADNLIEMSEKGGDWLTWDSFIARTAALAVSDSVSIDPHKLGYIPYPAGAVLLSDGRARHACSTDAPYLWKGQASDDTAFTGPFTLEGSRPGAAAAACWLAHKAIPLDQSGHGRLLALSILSTRRLYDTLGSPSDAVTGDGVHIARIHRPHCNILCYVPYHTQQDTLHEVNQVTNRILKMLHPAEQPEYMAVGTTMNLHANTPIEEGLNDDPRLAELLREQSGDTVSVEVIRSVVMGPFLLNAQFRYYSQGDKAEERLVLRGYVDHLRRTTSAASGSLWVDRANERLSHFKEELHFIVMDNDPEIGPFVRTEILAKLPLAESKIRWRFCKTEEEAIEEIKLTDRKLHAVFLDIDMQVPDANGFATGSIDAGYHVFEKIIERNRSLADHDYRVKSVFFFSQLSFQRDLVEKILETRPGHGLKVEYVEKPRKLDGVSAVEREALDRVAKILKTLFGMEPGE